MKPWEVQSFELQPPFRRTMKVLMGPNTHQVRNLSINMVIVPPGGESDIHAHAGSEEYWIVIYGRGEIEINMERTLIAPGMIIYAPPEAKHRIINTGNEPLAAYFFFAPPGPEKALLEIMKNDKTEEFNSDMAHKSCVKKTES